ncbi:MAG: tetratricopeptide repeat protein [Bacteroidaceae bacterium]|nr:tetratricopeptide repeat protein [Bacteroidaceae bacterium]
MKKVLFSISMLMLSCMVALAQADPKAYAKEVKKAEKDVKAAQKELALATGDINKAQALVDGAMKYPEITAQPDIWNVAGSIKRKHFDAEYQKLYLKQNPDYDKMYSSLYDVYTNFFKCDEVEKTAVDKKGRPVKVKYHNDNKTFLLGNRGWLINAGVKYYNDDKDNEKALKYFSLYINSANNPMLAGDSAIVNDTLITQIAYYASLASMQLKDYESVLKYTPTIKNDAKFAQYGYEFTASAYREMGDTVKWIAELQEGVKRYPDHNYFVGNLLDYYNTTNKFDEALKFANDMVVRDPNDSFMQYVKGYLCQNLKEYDDAITAYKAAIAIKPDYAEAHSNLGLVYCTLARDYQDKASTDVRSKQYKKDLEVIKGYYREAMPHYQKVRELKPDEQQMWLNGLYSIYYMLNMGKELEEIEKLMNN